MHDMGLMRKRPDITSSVSSVNGKEKYYPSITLNEEQMPILKGAKLGDALDVVVKFQVTGTRQPNDWSDSKTNQYDLEMVGCEKENDKETDDD